MEILGLVVTVIGGGCIIGLAMCFGYYKGYMQGQKDLSDNIQCLMDKYEVGIEEVS